MENLIRNALKDKYEILSQIGKGGMSTVYKAIQKNLDRAVAIKVVHQDLLTQDEFVRRFVQEAKICASLNNKNIITVYDAGSVDGVHYMAMEYLEGETLLQKIRHQGKLNEAEVVKYITPIADALDYIHYNKVVHRDIKSSNIFITTDGRPVLMDFGIVFSGERETFTRAGNFLGTPAYMSPEQAEGQLKPDGRSDIYSLGVVMYECLTGRIPFQSDNYMTTMLQVIHEVPPTVTSVNPIVPKWLGSIVTACMVKNREYRIQSGRKLADCLRSKTYIPPVRQPHTARTTPPASDMDEFSTHSGQDSLKSRNNTLLYSMVGLLALLLISLVMILRGNHPRTYQNGVHQINGYEYTQSGTVQKDSSLQGSNIYAEIAPAVPESDEIRADGHIFNGDLILIESGRFMMGCDGAFSNSCNGNDIPLHSVYLNNFYMGITEVTNRQYADFLNQYGDRKVRDGNFTGQIMVFESFSSGVYKSGREWKTAAGKETYPAIEVTWYGANEFCRYYGGRLPSEAEWEYAASGGKLNQRYTYSGSNELEDVSWFSGNSEDSPHRVAQKQANELGLYDMSGNAWEWCNDWYDKDYYGSSSPINPPGPETGEFKVLRGGSWMEANEEFFRSTSRYNLNPQSHDPDCGFRFVRNQ